MKRVLDYAIFMRGINSCCTIPRAVVWFIKRNNIRDPNLALFRVDPGVQLTTSPIANGYRKLCGAMIIFVSSPAGYKQSEFNIMLRAKSIVKPVEEHIFDTSVVLWYNSNMQ